MFDISREHGGTTAALRILPLLEVMGMRSSRLRILALLALAVAFGCGGGEDESQNEETAGGEDPWSDVDLGGDHRGIDVESMEESHPEQVADTEETATGPARITVVNRVGNEDVGGNVSVLDLEGEVVESGRSGATFVLEPGTYRLAGEITSDDDVLGKPSKQMEDTVTIEPGQQETLPVAFSVANVKLRVERNGRPVRTWRAQLTRRGSETPITLSSSDDFRHIQAGRYDGTVRFGAHNVEVENIIFQGGARGEIPIRVQ